MSTGEYSTRGNGNTLQQDLWRVEDEIKLAMREMRRELMDWHRLHTDEHHDLLADLAVRSTDFEHRLGEVVMTRVVGDAKREGALGVFRFIFTTLNTNWKVIALILAGALAFLNRVSISLT